MPPENLIEVSFEVANKVGGIYQVLKSKASSMQDQYGSGYLTVGMYDPEHAADDFTPRTDHPYEDVFDRLAEEGIECHYGVWDIPARPPCILVDASGLEQDIDQIKQELWDEFGIDSLNADVEFDDPVAWSHAVGRLLQELEPEMDGETVVHCHEWLTGNAVVDSPFPSVFTTHATVLGRALSNAGKDILEICHTSERADEISEEVEYQYTRINKIQSNRGDELATEYGVKARHQMERAAAEHADVFTTVSAVTAEEAYCILGVEPDVVLENGMNVSEYPDLEELTYQHRQNKQEMKRFLRSYFEPYYNIDVEDDPRILFISGRYEFHNKGLDMFIDALGDLNGRDGDEAFVFIFVPTDTAGPRASVLENQSLYEDLEDQVDALLEDSRSTILDAVTSGRGLEEAADRIIDADGHLDSLRRSFHDTTEGNPPLCAFELGYEQDRIIDQLRSNGITNAEDDRVRVVFYPIYLSVGDRLLSMSYDEAVSGATAGVFPSYYEPWGYTPVETAASGGVAITTDMAGFGQFILDSTEPEGRKGIQVLERKEQEYDAAVTDLADMMDEIVEMPKTELIERKHNARKLVQLTDWTDLIANYREAHDQALEAAQ